MMRSFMVLRKLCSILAFVILTGCAAFQAQAAPGYMNLHEGDFPRYVSRIVIDNFPIDEEGHSITWGAWTVSFVGTDPAVAKWNPEIDGRTGETTWGFSINHLKCHNDVVGDFIDQPKGNLCSITIIPEGALLSINFNGKWYMNQYIHLQDITFQ
ncbi:MAG: hypothetical protein ACYCOU_13640 [Sulfobacillus sp.]